jgi:TP901 family phage tail tape measure protein
MASPAAILQVFVNANTKVASAQLAAFQKQLHGVGKTSAATGVGMGKFTRGAAAAGTGIAAFGVAAAVAGKQLYDLGRQFDQAYDTIRVRTGATGRELESLKRVFKETAKDVPSDFDQIGVAIADLNTRLGLTGKPLERMAENMLNLSQITGDDLETNIKAVARSFVDWEVAVPKQTKYLNGMFRVSQASGASIAQLSEEVQRFGSPLRQLGFEFDEAVSMFASFERAGVNTQTMVPGLKLAISNLTRPTETLAEQMGKLGIQAGKPDKALRQIFDLLGKGSTLSQIEKTGLAMDVFGKRAGADMAEAISQGRFEVDKFLNLFRDNKGDTIKKAADETYDFSENVMILRNNLKIYLEPAANDVVVALDEMSRALNKAFDQLDGTSKKTTTLGNVLKTIKVILDIIKAPFSAVFKTMKYMVEGVIDVVKGLWKVLKGLRNISEGVLRGDWSRVWKGAKQVAAGAIQFIKGLFKTITAPARAAFEAVRDVIRDNFSRAYVVAANFVDKIIDVINLIPGIPDIGKINAGKPKNFKYGPTGPMGPTPKPQRSQRGGVLSGGSPSGDSIPAMLERGEYVLNRKAVEKIGVKRLNNINFKSAPRFQKGGAIGLQGGGYLDTLTEFPGKFVKPLADAGTAALDLLMNGPGQFLKMLPKPNIPQPFSGVGPYLLDKATSFIKKNATSPLKDNDWVDSNTFAVARFLSNKFNASISSDYRTPAENAAAGGVPNSSHTRGSASNPGAFDFVPPSGGMQSFAGKNIAGIVENMIHDVGSGLHNHIAFFQRGGYLKMQGGGLIKGKTSWFSPPDAPNTTADGKHTAADPGFAMRRYDTLGDWFWAKVGGKQGMLQHIDWGPAAWTGRTIDFTKAGLDKLGSSYDITDTMASVRWLGRTVKGAVARAKKLKLPLGGKAAGPSASEINKKKLKKLTSKVTRAGANFPQKGNLFKNGKAISKQQEIIDIAERNSGADFGPAGSDYSDEELAKAKQIWTVLQQLQLQRLKMLTEAKRYLLGLKKRYEKRRGKAKGPFKGAFSKGINAANKSLGQVNSDIRDLTGLTGRGGALGDTAFKLKELRFQSSGSATGDSEIASLLREQLTTSQRNLAIAQAQAPIFEQFMPKFHQGGVVQGPLGAERPIMAQAGEGVFTRDQMRAMGGAGNITVVIEDGAIDSNRIRVEVDGVLQDKISTVRRSTPNRRYATR